MKEKCFHSADFEIAQASLCCSGDKYPGKGDRFHERNKGKF